jgi:hypothetical protein
MAKKRTEKQEVEELVKAAETAADEKKKDDKWVKMVALTTTVVAVLTAIATMQSGGNTTKIQLLTTDENNKWSYFQAKSIKQHISEEQKNILEIDAQLPGNAGKTARAKLTDCTADIARYDSEKKSIQTDAENVSKQITTLKKRGGNFGNALLFFQIAVLLSSVSVLFHIKYMWQIGLVSAAGALIYLANAFMMLF